MKTISNRIKEIRKENHLSQSEFGKILAVSQDNVSLWETGKSFPSVQHIILISQIFKVSADYILGLSDF